MLVGIIFLEVITYYTDVLLLFSLFLFYLFDDSVYNRDLLEIYLVYNYYIHNLFTQKILRL